MHIEWKQYSIKVFSVFFIFRETLTQVIPTTSNQQDNAVKEKPNITETSKEFGQNENDLPPGVLKLEQDSSVVSSDSNPIRLDSEKDHDESKYEKPDIDSIHPKPDAENGENVDIQTKIFPYNPCNPKVQIGLLEDHCYVTLEIDNNTTKINSPAVVDSTKDPLALNMDIAVNSEETSSSGDISLNENEIDVTELMKSDSDVSINNQLFSVQQVDNEENEIETSQVLLDQEMYSSSKYPCLFTSFTAQQAHDIIKDYGEETMTTFVSMRKMKRYGITGNFHFDFNFNF